MFGQPRLGPIYLLRTAVTSMLLVLIVPALAAEPHSKARPEADVVAAIDALRQAQTDKFVAVLDMDKLTDRILFNVELREAVERGFRAGVASEREGLARGLASVLSAAESVTHLKTKQSRGFVKLLYRLDFAEQGINYHEYMVDETTGRVFDWYDYVLGRSASETMRNVAIPVLGPQSMSGLVMTMFDDSEEQADVVKAMLEAAVDKDHAKILSLYRTAPDAVQGHEAALNYLIIAASNVGADSADYEYALGQVARHGANNPRYSLMLLDYYLMRGEFDKCIDAANVLQERLGVVDSGVAEMKAGIYLTKGDADSAIRQFERSAEVEPDRDTAFASLFQLYATGGRYSDAQRMLDVLNESFDYGLSAEDFAHDRELEGYVAWARVASR